MKEPARHLVAGLHSRGKLPHLKREGASYFVTFRLADSLPQAVIAQLKREREAILQKALTAKRPLTWQEEQQLFLWYSERVESYLDAGTGDCWLHRPEIADLVARSLNHFKSERYDLPVWVVMPNHVHAIVWPYPDFRLDQILHSWKSFTANESNRLLSRVGNLFWQTESYDHWIRNDEERVRLSAYIANNPVKAGLAARPEDWPWSSASPTTQRFMRQGT